MEIQMSVKVSLVKPNSFVRLHLGIGSVGKQNF